MNVKLKIAALFVCMTVVCGAKPCHSDQSERANNFTCTLATGGDTTLYSVQAEAVLLFFYDPTCDECHELMARLDESPVITRLIEDKHLIVMAVYPEEDVDVWRENMDYVPETWLNGYDPGAKIILDDLYDFSTLPTLYLLDRQKCYLLKKTTADEVEITLENLF
ncbi:MAG: thioredoxin family protein [Tannerella sp.]|jgi:hypothetical protein|nr:thioredoxin family protein [Tannerella sp.]